jgi:hypothetical protein
MASFSDLPYEIRWKILRINTKNAFGKRVKSFNNLYTPYKCTFFQYGAFTANWNFRLKKYESTGTRHINLVVNVDGSHIRFEYRWSCQPMCCTIHSCFFAISRWSHGDDMKVIMGTFDNCKNFNNKSIS